MTEICGWRAWPNKVSDPICRRPFTRENGWGFRACEGHMRIGELNKNQCSGMSIDDCVQKYKDAIQWLRDNPNPPKEIE